MNSDPDPILSDELRHLIIGYMKACNAGDDAKADELISKIRERRKHECDT